MQPRPPVFVVALDAGFAAACEVDVFTVDASPRTCRPSLPRTSVTRFTEAVRTVCAPGTTASTAFAALCLPAGYSICVPDCELLLESTV
jgi:hypothetical protein